MGIKTTIHGQKTGASAQVVQAGATKGDAGLVVYTEPRQRPVSVVKKFLNSIYGEDLNQNAGFGGTPAGIHDGTDSVLWTGSVLGGPSSKFDFASTAQAFAGTKSIDASASTDGVGAVFTTGSPVTVASYVAFTMYVYITSWDTTDNTRDITITPRLSGVAVGNVVSVASRINRQSTGNWQKVVIPFEDFSISTATIDSIVMTTVATSGTPPDYFADNLQLEQTGTPLTYRMSPTKSKILEVTGYNIFIADVLDTTLASNSMPKLAYNTLLGVTLSSGISEISVQQGVESGGGVFFGIGDFISQLGKPTITSGYDGTNAWINIHVEIQPTLLDSSFRDSIAFELSDDLTGLTKFTIAAFGKEYVIGE